MWLFPRCQRQCIIGRHQPLARVASRLRDGLGLRSGLRRALSPPAAQAPLGPPSRFAAGDWVRVRDEAEVRATLDPRQRLRGLAFVPSQWATCGGVYQVEQVVRRLLDDRGLLRPVGRTVLLSSVTCAGAGGAEGCGRHCPLMYRDEWLEPAAAPARPPEEGALGPLVTVRPAAELAASLDAFGRRDGLLLMREMYRHAGTSARVLRQLPRVFEHDRWTEPRRPVYLLAGLHCGGEALGADGPCHRRCPLLWHEDWLRFS